MWQQAKPAAIVILAALLLWSLSHFRPRSVAASRDYPPGWDALADCSETTSFDSKKGLSLRYDSSAKLVDRTDGKAQVERGRWSLVDEEKHLYRVDVEGVVGNYWLLSPPDADGCMLAFGDVAAADLRHSWFSVHLEGDLPDRQP